MEFYEVRFFPRGAEGGTELENQICMEEPARLWNRQIPVSFV